ncbi:MarR family transcriptional regulator [Rhodococcus oxybenzonivorans]|uniref:MarR family winged helix-turn-helix transcriptional regulator n=1 Tax=Rhodococcus oxybenzonivorans TaxID=1990687 RepID=UPI002953DC9E|nr:MarR family transcriptional regulator [Rhodococcus oxybenzonivorans]MDV7353702.1 MarR family transcriptional regulator [Rhodococcus oxybenzonivorans]
MGDAIDDVQDQLARVRPGIDTSSAAIIGRVMTVARMVQSESNAVLRRHEVTRADFDILSLLLRTGEPMPPTQLAVQLHTSGAGTTKRVQKLEAAGLVERTNNPTDGRGFLVTLTPKAEAVIGPALESVAELERSLLASLSNTDRTALTDQLRKLLASVTDARPSVR